MRTKNVLAIGIVGLYVVVTLAILGWNLISDAGDLAHFFDQMGKANFLLGPVGFVLGHYFGGSAHAV